MLNSSNSKLKFDWLLRCSDNSRGAPVSQVDFLVIKIVLTDSCLSKKDLQVFSRGFCTENSVCG